MDVIYFGSFDTMKMSAGPEKLTQGKGGGRVWTTGFESQGTEKWRKREPIQSWLGLVCIELVTVTENWSSTLLVMF